MDVDAEEETLAVDWEVERIEPPVRIVDLAQIRNLPLASLPMRSWSRCAVAVATGRWGRGPARPWPRSWP